MRTRQTASIFLTAVLAGCGGTEEEAVDIGYQQDAHLGDSDDICEDNESDFNPDCISTECSWLNGRGWQLIIPGTGKPYAETYAIWNLGSAINHTATYDTPERADLLMIIPGAEHTVDGFPDFDHDHIVSRFAFSYDVFLSVPGPNFDPETYQRPKSIADHAALAAAGVLSPALRLPDAGFPALVLDAPLSFIPCRPAPLEL
jgi:hypothetical protein